MEFGNGVYVIVKSVCKLIETVIRKGAFSTAASANATKAKQDERIATQRTTLIALRKFFFI